MKKKNITVEMLFSWTFNEKDWSEQKEHIQEMLTNPQIVFGYDMIHSFYTLNDIVAPNLKNIEVSSVDE